MWLVGVVIRRYIDILIIIINFPYSTCIRSFLAAASLLLCSFLYYINLVLYTEYSAYYCHTVIYKVLLSVAYYALFVKEGTFKPLLLKNRKVDVLAHKCLSKKDIPLCCIDAQGCSTLLMFFRTILDNYGIAGNFCAEEMFMILRVKY